MTDKYEPYLEPLFIPGVLGLFTALIFVYNGIYYYYDVPNKILGYGGILFLTLLVPISLAVLLYEILIIAKIIKPGVFVNTQRKFYKFFRWLLAMMGIFVIVSSCFLAYWLIIMSQASAFIPG